MIRSLFDWKTGILARLTHITAVILVFSSLLIFTLPPITLAASNSTTVGELELVAAYENIGVHSHFTGDDNGNNSTLLRYRVYGSGTWITGVDLYKDTRDEVIEVGLYGDPIEGPYGIPNPYKDEYRGIIFGLEPNTDYEVEVVYTDPDGVSGTARTVIRTLDFDPPSTGNNYWVDPDRGSDSNPGTEASPWATVQHAADSVSAGDTVNISGTITEGGSAYGGRGIEVRNSGTPDNYITFQSADPENMAVFNGEGTRWHALQLFGSYIRIRNLEMTNYHGDPGGAVVIGGRQDEGADLVTGNIVENCTISDPGGSWACAGVLLRYSEASLIQNNYIYSTAYDDRSSAYGIFFFGTTGKNVVRNNYIYSDAVYKDSIGGIANFSMNGGSGPDSFIYDNYIYGSWDDGIEIEGGNCNVAVWGNIIKNNDVDSGGASMNMGIGISSTIVGPLYVMRNVIIDHGDAAFKTGTSSYGPMYIYHNTIYSPRGGTGIGHFGNNAITEDYHVLNNIFYLTGGGRCVENWYNQFIEGNDWWPIPGSAAGIEYDNNCWWTSRNEGHFSVAWLRNPNGDGSGWTHELPGSWQTELGFDINGFVDEPQLVNPGADNFSLAADSPCINTGAVIQGINDANSLWAYSGSAPDIGAYEYGSGGATNNPPVLNPIGNKSINTEELLQFTISATDFDGDSLTYSASNLPSGATFTPSTRTFSWTPSSNQAGTYSNVRFEVSDGELTDSENITITVNSAGNDPPVLSAIGNKSVNIEGLLQFTISATDPDGDSLTYSASNLPSGATFTPSTRTFSWTPTSSQAGTYSDIHFEVSDGELTDSENITITVTSGGGSSALLRVNASGDEYVDSLGNTWQADQTYVTGSWGFYGSNNIADRGTSHSISGTIDDRIYQTERWGLSGYQCDIDNGTYTVILHFAETYFTSSGQRVFDISIEGQLLLDNLDIYSEVGYSTALVKTFNNITVQDGRIDIELNSSVDEPEINGIEIISASVSDGGGNTGASGTGDGGNTGASSAGSGGSTPPGTTFFSNIVNPEGYFIQRASASSADNLVKITIPEGVKALNSYGDPLTYVTIVKMDVLPDQTSDQTAIGPIYDFGPDGAIFDPAITLTITYVPALMPEGIDEEGLTIVVWDASNTTWLKLPSVVDTANHTIATEINSFSSYTIMTLPPEVITGIASITGNRSAMLNGNLIDSGSASLVEVYFEWSSEPGGTYPNNTAPQFMSTTGDFSFTLNDLEVETTYYFRAVAAAIGMVYSEEASFILPAFPAVVSTGDASDITQNSATLHALLEDLGTTGAVTVSFEWGENQGGPYPYCTQSERIYATTDYCYTLTNLEAGKTYYYRLVVQSIDTVYGNEKSFDTPVSLVTQSPSPAVFFTDKLMISPDVATIGEPISISLEVSNTGGQDGSYTVRLAINDIIEEARDIILDTGESQIVSFTVNKMTSGIYEVAIDNQYGTFEISPRPVSKNWLLIGGAIIALGILVVTLLYKQKI